MPEVSPRRLALVTATAVFALDRFTKWIIEARVSSYDTYTVIPNFFSIVHSQNRGAAFGLFSDSPAEWRALLLVVASLAAIAFVGAMIWRARSVDALTVWGLALLLGGACGNVFDRVLRGSVTDFLLFYLGEYQWPAFNVADSAITIGCGLLILESFKSRKQPAQT
jgi:signal peptidase II